MASELLESRLAFELAPINKALQAALVQLPLPVRPVAEHILGAGGKRLRPFLTVICARMLGHEGDDIHILAASMEMLHAATLLHDDVLDKADTRRGRKAAHTVFGAAGAILAGDALLAAGNALVASFDDPAFVKCYSLATSKTAAGEILEMSSLRDPELGRKEYLEIAREKTGYLISSACQLGALAAQASPDQVQSCAAFGENLGIAFQLVDDALDLSPDDKTGKPKGGDLKEGKMTLPIRLYRDSLSPGARSEFDAKFSASSFSEEEIDKIIAQSAPFCTETREEASGYLKLASEALANLPDNKERHILREMCGYIASRKN